MKATRKVITQAVAIVAVAASATFFAMAGPATAPAVLPAGHPAIPNQNSATEVALPAGHPGIGAAENGAAPALPAGHPALPSQDSGTEVPLPAGHPGIARNATTQPAALGTLVIRAIQSTPNGPAIRADKVTLELYQNGQLASSVSGTLDKNGIVTVPDVPIHAQTQPLVRITHGGAEYEIVGNPMDAKNTLQEIKVPVYETTEIAPTWNVAMRHIIVDPAADGVHVMEMIAVQNPTAKAWLGDPTPDGKHVTFAWPLPAGARDVELGGAFREEFAKVENGKIVNGSAIVPGTERYQIGYVLPSTNGKTEIALTSPAEVKHLMVFVPDDGSTVQTDGVAAAGATDMGGAKTRFYKAGDIAAGKVLKVTLSGLRPTAANMTATEPTANTAPDTATSADVPPPDTTAKTAQIAAGVGGVVIVLFGGGFMLAKASTAAKRAGTSA